MRRRTFLAASAALPIVGITRGKDPKAVRSIPLQPEPVDWMAIEAGAGGVDFTSVAREWRPGDEQRCQLCPLERCMARKLRRYSCIVAVPDSIPRDQVRMFSLTDWLKERGIS
jgi:hypothetical protein